ncbi:MAG TPA: sulfotransferase [Sphingomicrobium sp.]|nr:sulfotransferase [Sphingomicrobium sp.]
MVLASGRTREAASHKSKVALDFALAALRAGDVAGAELRLRDALLADPFNADALVKLAEIAVEQRRIEDATVLLRKAVTADLNPERRLELIYHLQRFGGPGLVLNELQELPAEIRERHEVKAIEAGTRGILGDHEEQIRIYEEMAHERPRQAGLWMSLGNALKTVGRTDEAVDALRRALKVQPTYGEAYWTLANFKSFRFLPRELNQMRQALRKKLPDEDALHLYFALGKAYEDSGDYEESFAQYAAGNVLRAEEFTPDQSSATEFVDEAIATFTPEFFERNRGAGCRERGPIFVVGLHRSGSTLIEQILASHPLVEGTAELATINLIRNRIARATGLSPCAAIAQLEPAQFADIGAEYLERTRAFRMTDRPYFVDKMPNNWMNLALIRLALPNATIIDARRHPLACGFSNFKQNYANGVGYSYSLTTIGAFYRDYWRFVRHFDAVQPGAVRHMLNERLIENPEGEIRGLLDFAGLPFDPACLSSHANTRAVRTPSAEQVRKPINREGVDYWRHYEPWLDELKRALGPALEGWET